MSNTFVVPRSKIINRIYEGSECVSFEYVQEYFKNEQGKTNNLYIKFLKNENSWNVLTVLNGFKFAESQIITFDFEPPTKTMPLEGICEIGLKMVQKALQEINFKVLKINLAIDYDFYENERV